jgi:hypothetical protein
MINNYKSIRNVRAEAGGAVDLGEPVSLYIAQDEYKVTGTNIIENGDFETGSALPWVNNDMDTFAISTSYATGTYSLHMTVGDADDYASVNLTTKAGSQYVLKFNRTITNHDAGSSIKFRIAGGALGDTFASTTDIGTSRFREEIYFTAISTSTSFVVQEYSTGTAGNDADIYIDDIQCYEVSDFSYKLMAINDVIPNYAVNVSAGEGVGAELSDLLSTDQETALADSLAADNDSFDFATSTSTLLVTDGFTGTTATFANASGVGRLQNDGTAVAKVTLPLITVVGRRYDVEFDVTAVSGGISCTVSLSADLNVDLGSQATGIGVSTDNNLNAPFTATGVESYLVIQNDSSNTNRFVELDDLKVYEVFGYDYYNAPSYKFGIVSNIWDQDSGGLISTAAAGDTLEVTVQGECIVRGSSSTETESDVISKISTSGDISNNDPSNDNMLPNSVGVCQGNSSSTTKPIILFQGVEFSESFVHKNSLQVHAKCDEAITKFRPVSLFLDSAGDLLCRHDDIPEETPSVDTDHTGVDPGKWGIAELVGASGEVIPITVAGKTHVNTSETKTAGELIAYIKESGSINQTSINNNLLPNAIGTVMESTTGDVPITIFGGTPIGTITDWKRTIKITAKANGAVTQYCPVSLYLDQYGEYKCISDDIPNSVTSSANAIWVDFRKWGVAQTTVADGEFVEIIVQGRTSVVNARDYADRTEFIIKISAAGAATSSSTAATALTSLGIIEKEAKSSDASPGVIIIF